MSESSDWNEVVGIAPDRAAAFAELAGQLGSTPAEMIRLMIEKVLDLDRQLAALGLGPTARWRTSTEAHGMVPEAALAGLPLDIQPTGFMWPPDKPFPWSAADCKAAVLGYKVRWHGTFDDFITHLPGVWEMVDGYAVVHQP